MKWLTYRLGHKIHVSCWLVPFWTGCSEHGKMHRNSKQLTGFFFFYYREKKRGSLRQGNSYIFPLLLDMFEHCRLCVDLVCVFLSDWSSQVLPFYLFLSDSSNSVNTFGGVSWETAPKQCHQAGQLTIAPSLGCCLEPAVLRPHELYHMSARDWTRGFANARHVPPDSWLTPSSLFKTILV